MHEREVRKGSVPRRGISARLISIFLLLSSLLALCSFALPFVAASASREIHEVYNDPAPYTCEDESYTINVSGLGVHGYILEENVRNGWFFANRSSVDARADCQMDSSLTRVVCSALDSADKSLTFEVRNLLGLGGPYANTFNGTIWDDAHPSGTAVAGPTSFAVKSKILCQAEADNDFWVNDGAGAQLNVCGCKSRTVYDCDDFNGTINPEGTEVCGNGVDENCNGMVDDICSSTVTRSFPPPLRPGQTISVNLSLAWTGGEASVVINDSYDLTAFACMGVSHGGLCVPATNLVQWVRTDQANVTVHYNLTILREGSFLFAGRYAYMNRSEYPILGEQIYSSFSWVNVSGVVYDEYGYRVADARVANYPLYGERNNTFSLPDGTYRINNVPTGTYYMDAWKPGYLSDYKLVTFLPGFNQYNLDFTLKNGSCHADCTDIYRRCNRGCDGQTFSSGTQTCAFHDEIAISVCNGRLKGTHAIYNTTGNVTFIIDCCEGTPYPVYRPDATISGSMKDLIKYTRIVMYQSRPVKLVVAVWE